MPCCCETNLKAIFVLGILGLVISGLGAIFGNYASLIGIVASICYIVGAKAPNPSALLVGMIFTCIHCVAMIIMSIVLIVAASIIENTTSTRDLNSILMDGGLSQNDLQGLKHQDIKDGAWVLAIVGVVYTVGAVIFLIWTIMVANKARKEIDEGIKI